MAVFGLFTKPSNLRKYAIIGCDWSKKDDIKRHFKDIPLILGFEYSERSSMWTININKEKKLLKLKLSDTLTLNELSEFLEEIYDKNEGKFAAFNRFVDLSALKEIKIDLDTVSSHVHEYRRKVKPDAPVKVSLFIPQKYIRGFSYLYKSMLSDGQFKIEILESLDKCAEFLSVDKNLLQNEARTQ